jgi:hypothetical protein
VFLFSLIHAKCPTHFILLDSIILIRRSSSLCCFLHMRRKRLTKKLSTSCIYRGTNGLCRQQFLILRYIHKVFIQL